MGMIRVSDSVEGRLKEVADGRSMNATVEKMLAYCSSPEGFCVVKEAGADDREYFEAKFDRLEELIRRAAGEY